MSTFILLATMAMLILFYYLAINFKELILRLRTKIVSALFGAFCKPVIDSKTLQSVACYQLVRKSRLSRRHRKVFMQTVKLRRDRHTQEAQERTHLHQRQFQDMMEKAVALIGENQGLQENLDNCQQGINALQETVRSIADGQVLIQRSLASDTLQGRHPTMKLSEHRDLMNAQSNKNEREVAELRDQIEATKAQYQVLSQQCQGCRSTRPRRAENRRSKFRRPSENTSTGIEGQLSQGTLTSHGVYSTRGTQTTPSLPVLRTQDVAAKGDRTGDQTKTTIADNASVPVEPSTQETQPQGISNEASVNISPPKSDDGDTNQQSLDDSNEAESVQLTDAVAHLSEHAELASTSSLVPNPLRLPLEISTNPSIQSLADESRQGDQEPAVTASGTTPKGLRPQVVMPDSAIILRDLPLSTEARVLIEAAATSLHGPFYADMQSNFMTNVFAAAVDQVNASKRAKGKLTSARRHVDFRTNDWIQKTVAGQSPSNDTTGYEVHGKIDTPVKENTDKQPQSLVPSLNIVKTLILESPTSNTATFQQPVEDKGKDKGEASPEGLDSQMEQSATPIVVPIDISTGLDATTGDLTYLALQPSAMVIDADFRSYTDNPTVDNVLDTDDMDVIEEANATIVVPMQTNKSNQPGSYAITEPSTEALCEKSTQQQQNGSDLPAKKSAVDTKMEEADDNTSQGFDSTTSHTRAFRETSKALTQGLILPDALQFLHTEMVIAPAEYLPCTAGLDPSSFTLSVPGMIDIGNTECAGVIEEAAPLLPLPPNPEFDFVGQSSQPSADDVAPLPPNPEPEIVNPPHQSMKCEEQEAILQGMLDEVFEALLRGENIVTNSVNGNDSSSPQTEDPICLPAKDGSFSGDPNLITEVGDAGVSASGGFLDEHQGNLGNEDQTSSLQDPTLLSFFKIDAEDEPGPHESKDWPERDRKEDGEVIVNAIENSAISQPVFGIHYDGNETLANFFGHVPCDRVQSLSNYVSPSFIHIFPPLSHGYTQWQVPSNRPPPSHIPCAIDSNSQLDAISHGVSIPAMKVTNEAGTYLNPLPWHTPPVASHILAPISPNARYAQMPRRSLTVTSPTFIPLPSPSSPEASDPDTGLTSSDGSKGEDGTQPALPESVSDRLHRKVNAQCHVEYYERFLRREESRVKPEQSGEYQRSRIMIEEATKSLVHFRGSLRTIRQERIEKKDKQYKGHPQYDAVKETNDQVDSEVLQQQLVTAANNRLMAARWQSQLESNGEAKTDEGEEKQEVTPSPTVALTPVSQTRSAYDSWMQTTLPPARSGVPVMMARAENRTARPVRAKNQKQGSRRR